jgi:hypothetical protein
MTPGCNGKVKTRGVCTKCYSTLRVYVQKGKLTWDGAAAAGLCLGSGEGSNLSPMQAALAAAEEKGLKFGESMPVPQVDPDQEPPEEPAQPAVPQAPPGFYYDANWQLQPIPKVQMPQIDNSPMGYAAYDPAAPAAADIPHTPVPRDAPRPEAHDPMDDIEDEMYLDDETPEQKARRKAIERRHKREQEARYIEENGIQPPKGGQVVQVVGGKKTYSLNADPTQQILEGGVGAGPPEGSRIPPGIYLQQHDTPAQQTIDGEPLLPGWSIAPDGRNLINPQGQIVDTTPRPAAPQASPPQAVMLQTPNSPPQTAQILSPVNVNVPAPNGQVANIQGGLILPPNVQGAPAPQYHPDPAQSTSAKVISPAPVAGAQPPWEGQ